MRALLFAAILVAPTAAFGQELAIDPFGSLFPADGSSNVDQSIGQKGIFVTFISSGGGAYMAGDPALPLQLGGASVQVSIGGDPPIACALGNPTPGVGECGFVASDGPFANGVIESIEILLGDILDLNTQVELTLSGILSSLPGDVAFNLADWDFTTRLTPFPRDPLLVELVLDTSGSMNWSAVPGAPPGAPRRREAMRAGIIPLFSLLGQYGQASDRVGTIYFNSTAEPFDTSLPDKTVGVLAGESDAMRDDILATLDAPTSGSTSIGDGLDKAVTDGFDTISPAPGGSTNRVVVLMSDGEQNRAPMVTVPGGTLQVGGVNYPADITVHPITAGRMLAPGAALQSSIATATGGNAPLHVEDTADSIPEANFQTYFVQTLADELVGDKVEMVLDETGTLASGNKVEFAIPATSDEVALSFFFSVRDPSGKVGEMRPIPYLFAPDGTEVELRRFLRFGEREVSAKVPLPALAPKGFLRSRGEWRLVFGGDLPDVFYHAMVLLDNTMVVTKFALDGALHATGQPIKIEANLTEADDPLKEAEVVAVVRRPLAGLGNVLSDAKVEPQDNTGGEPFNAASAKLSAVLQDPELADQLRAKGEDVIKLLDNGDLANGDAVAGDGIYSGLYFDTTVEGDYAFDVTALAENRNGEIVRRVRSLTTRTLPAPDRGKSSFQVVKIDEAADGGARAVISATLKDSFDNKLGPGYDQGALKLTPDRGKVERRVDRLDGSYEIYLALPPLPGGEPALKGPPVHLQVSVLGGDGFKVAFKELGDGSAGQGCTIGRAELEKALAITFEDAMRKARDREQRRKLRELLKGVIQVLRAQ